MESEKRFQQICKNLCLLLTAILHFVHTMVQPVLMSISASRNTKKSSHIRVRTSLSLRVEHSHRSRYSALIGGILWYYGTMP